MKIPFYFKCSKNSNNEIINNIKCKKPKVPFLINLVMNQLMENKLYIKYTMYMNS